MITDTLGCEQSPKQFAKSAVFNRGIVVMYDWPEIYSLQYVRMTPKERRAVDRAIKRQCKRLRKHFFELP